MEWHVSAELIQRFAAGEASPEEGARLVRHLLRGCRECTSLVSSAWRGQASASDYEQAFAEAFRFASEMEEQLAVEKLRGWAQWSELEPLPAADRLAIVRSQPAYQTLGLYERLLEAAQWYRRRDPVEAADIVKLALSLVECMPSLSETRRADLRARTWAQLANAYRLAAQFGKAREAINTAWKIYDEESGKDPADRALLVSIETSYMVAQGEFEVAESHLDEALRIYRRMGDEHHQGKILIQMGSAIGHVDPERGIQHTRRGLGMISASLEPRLEWCGRHNLAWFLCDAGKAVDALVVLEQARPLYAMFPDSYTQLRMHWLEGRIAFQRGDFAEARSVLTQVWDEFSSRNMEQETVLVTLDLAEALAMEGKMDEAAKLAREVHTVMARWGLHLDALQAWILFAKLLEQKQLHLVAELRTYYRRFWHRAAPFIEVDLGRAN